MIRSARILFLLILILSLAHSRYILGATQTPVDSTSHILEREESIPFRHTCCKSVHLGDTLLIIPKREIKNGIIVDYPPEQRYEAHLTDGKDHAAFVFPDGNTSVDTSEITMPIKLFVGRVVSAHLSWKIFALRVDTSNDMILRRMSNKEMFQRLTAPNNEAKSYMIEHAGYLQLYAKNYEGARECFKETLELDSSLRSTIYYDYACSYARENKTPQALQWLHFAFINGYDKYDKVIKTDSDLVSIRFLPEFKKIVTAYLGKQRMEYFEKVRMNPQYENDYIPLICKNYLYQSDIDSFYVYFNKYIEKGKFPSISDYEEIDSTITRDPRYMAILDKYLESNKDFIFNDYQMDENPYVVSRLECKRIPFKLKKCKNLSELIIQSGAISKLPPELAEFKRFRILRYINCGFDSFPEVLTRCINLDTLIFDKGRSNSLPDNFGNLINLKHLELRNGLLKNLPASFGNLASLTNLSLSNNSFSTFPDELIALKNIEVLDISSNSIAVIPDDIQMLTQIDTLILPNNKLDSVPAALGALKNLVYLDLSRNHLTSLPEEIGSLAKLTYLDISLNELERIPGCIKALKSLRTLIINGNFLNNFELYELRSLLPGCSIIDNGQKISKRQLTENAKTFFDEQIGLSFKYPSQYELIEQKDESKSGKIEILLNYSSLLAKEMASSEDMQNYYCKITILFTRRSMDELVEEYVIKGNQITTKIIEGWEGFYASSNAVDRRPFIFIARKNFIKEPVSIIYTGGEEAEYFMKFILSSFQLSSKSKSGQSAKGAPSAKGIKR